jgi:hypothetical protein
MRGGVVPHLTGAETDARVVAGEGESGAGSPRGDAERHLRFGTLTTAVSRPLGRPSAGNRSQEP